MYDSSSSIDFELHESEETELVIKILELCGILIKDSGASNNISTVGEIFQISDSGIKNYILLNINQHLTTQQL